MNNDKSKLLDTGFERLQEEGKLNIYTTRDPPDLLKPKRVPLPAAASDDASADASTFRDAFKMPQGNYMIGGAVVFGCIGIAIGVGIYYFCRRKTAKPVPNNVNDMDNNNNPGAPVGNGTPPERPRFRSDTSTSSLFSQGPPPTRSPLRDELPLESPQSTAPTPTLSIDDPTESAVATHNDPSTLAEFRLQDRQFKLDMQLQSEQFRENSNMEIKRDLDKLQETLLPKGLDECHNAVRGGLNNSAFVFFLFEGIACWGKPIQEFVSLASPNAQMEKFFGMLCPACELDLHQVVAEDWFSFFKNIPVQAVSYVLPDNAICWGTCAVSYVLLVLAGMVVHFTLILLHTPWCVHQLVNATPFIAAVMYSPRAMADIQTYLRWLGIVVAVNLCMYGLSLWRLYSQKAKIKQSIAKLKTGVRSDNPDKQFLFKAQDDLDDMQGLAFWFESVPAFVLFLVMVVGWNHKALGGMIQELLVGKIPKG